MEDISLHILDIVENSIAAGADRVKIKVNEDRKNDIMSIKIEDNGKGMSQTTLKKAPDPFFTRKKTRRVGLGLSLLRQAAETAGGRFSIDSQKGKGTTVKATFQYSHIDRQPLGDMTETIETLVIGNPNVDFQYEHKKDGVLSTFDTKRIKKQLSKTPLSSPRGIRMVRESLKEAERCLQKVDSK